jgi:phosphate transport system substrate-binding protein
MIPFMQSEDSIVKLFMDDSVRLIITSRLLNGSEEEFLKSKLVNPRTTKIAYDALALVINKDNPLKLIRYNTVRDIFTVSISNWNQVDPSVKYGNIRVVFDNRGSSNVRLITRKFGLNSLPDFVFAAGSHDISD